MRTTNLKDLTDTVEQLRKELHPDLDSGFLRAVVRAEEQNPEDDVEALRAIETVLNQVLVAKGVG